MKRSLLCRIIACCVILTIATLNVFAEQPPRKIERASERAFLRGGQAISDALHERTAKADPLIPPKPTLPGQANAALPPAEGKHRRTMLWIGIAVTGAIATYLIQRSVRNHGHIFGSGV